MKKKFQNLTLRLEYKMLAAVMSMWFLYPGYVLADMEFFSIAENAIVMYDAPSLQADKLFVAGRHLPVEVVVDVEGWAKVRDSSGSLAWVQKKDLSQQRYVIVIVPLADVHQSADIKSELIFQVEENIVMEWMPSDIQGWIKVRHRDGQTGYIKVNQVWGS
jgi:SH3-like domain-containing protein